MKKRLIIVESPTKVKTIKKFLGSNYEVVASQGHVRDLPKSTLGIDVDNDFEPKYITIRGKGEKIKELKKAAKKADKVFLATDPDREGEAIAWHLHHILSLNDDNYARITFNEITKSAVKASLSNPGKINEDLVNAQQARRELDRLVGYSISPILWAKVKRGLSAGRVQSAALKIICDREAEIDAFIPQEYWNLDAVLKVEGERKTVTAKFYGDKKEKIVIENKEQRDSIAKAIEKEEFLIDDIKNGERVKKAPLPFTTSTLQQEASKLLNFSASKTMRIAQSLYEGVDVAGHGTVGLITYLRTDSTRVSDEAKAMAEKYIVENFGKEFTGSKAGAAKSNSKIQDAHEAIRPSNVELSPVIVKESLSRDEFRLYQLIWKRFLASRMKNAVYNTTAVKISAGDYIFKANTSSVKFNGFLVIYNDDEEKVKEDTLLTALTKDSVLKFKEFESEQHFTQPPAHYTEASLVKELEENGIGRPSTYAPTISTLLNRRYVVKEKKNLFVSELGLVINNIMTSSFPKIVDPGFTALMEEELDKIEEGELEWKELIRRFYPGFKESVEKAEKELENVKIEDEVTDVICEKCGRNMVVKYGPHGKFLACPGFPECRNAKPYLEPIGVACPKCGNDIVMKKTKKGRVFYGCSSYPDCDYTSWQRPAKKPCPDCGGIMVYKGKKLVCENMECGHIEKADE